MIRLNYSLTLALRSLKLDIEFLFCHYPKRLTGKLEFIVKKYLLLTKHLFLNIQPKPGKSKVNISKKWIYYESSFGISGLQSMIVNVEKNFLKHIQPLKQPTIIDVGAHLGFFSLTLANLLDKPQIYACEPVSLAFKLLKKNCRQVKVITPVHRGFSNKNSKTRIYYVSNLLMYSSLFPERFKWTKRPSSEIVQLQTLDAFIKETGIDLIDLLKIDTEGSEEKILQGAQNTLRQTRYLAIEFPLDQVGGTTFSSIARCLYGPKYNFQLVNIGNALYGPAGEVLTIDLFFENQTKPLFGQR